MLSDPGAACATHHFSLHMLLASELVTPSPYPILCISRLNHFSLRLRPVGSLPLCLIFGITPADPRFASRRVANPYRSGSLTHQNKRPCPAALLKYTYLPHILSFPPSFLGFSSYPVRKTDIKSVFSKLKKGSPMTPRVKNNAANEAVEVLMSNGMDGLAGAVEILLNTAMRMANSSSKCTTFG